MIDTQKNVVKDKAEVNSKAKLVKRLIQWIVTLVLAVEKKLRKMVRVVETGARPKCKTLRIMSTKVSIK